MNYKISDKAKKVTLGVAIVGLVLLVIGFFQQKEFVYANKIDDHSVEIKYNGHADQDAQNALKESITSKLACLRVTRAMAISLSLKEPISKI